ncbi:MAG: hypothetical protein ACRDEB_03775 [Chitinophagaceae bacterium]
MKRMILFTFLFPFLEMNGQNEFAATAFYQDFKKIYEDAQAGFITYKGELRKSDFEELATEFKVKLLLPLADSGKIVFPVSGNRPFVVYYFEASKIRLKVDQRAMNLRDALITAFEKPIYSRTETTFINNHPYTNSYYFTDPDETRADMAEFRITIYYKEGKYFLSFEIRGKK